MHDGRMVTAIVPARDEESSIGVVLNDLKSLTGVAAGHLVDQLIVCDNGSTDNTAKIAAAHNAIVVFEITPGYSPACHAALNRFFRTPYSDSDILVFVDADQSMPVCDLEELLTPISNGAELVIGARTGSKVETGALNFQQRWGNRLATMLIKLFWGVRYADLGPFRAITAGALKKIDMQDQTYGWTTEMQVRAIQENLNVVEVPVATRRRVGRSKISGSIVGNIRAGRAILGTIFKLWRNEKR